MDSAIDVPGTLEIESTPNDLARRVSSTVGLSSSPIATFTSSSWRDPGVGPVRCNTGASSKQLKPFNTEDIKILLLENVNKTGRDLLEGQGYQVTFLKKALSEDELIEKIRWGNGWLFIFLSIPILIHSKGTSKLLAYAPRPN